ncbi:MAG: 2-octaprenyl-6-methoxyphenyl hydroxylase [Marinobacterium sp.]|nr:2-octaprenyl-6-methoxyphenyl hydroxylase [Marinobacterium sp.]
MKQQYDLIIIGGGMVGASLACALLPAADQLGLSIAVVETHPLPDGPLSYTPSYDARATALAYGSRASYQQMGVWEMLSEHLTPIQHIHVSDKGRFGVTRLHAEQEQVEALGYVVENHWLGRVLLDRLHHSDAMRHVDFICPAEVTALQPQPGHMEVTLYQGEQQHQLRAELVVMADGGRSSLREQLGIHYRTERYQQHAIVTNVSPEQPHGGIAYERFTDTGPMALLPLEDQGGLHRCGLVWTVADEQLDEVLALDDDAFIRRLHERFGYRAGRFVRVGERHHYPLKLMLAEEQVRANLVVLGNAAHALHPIAGQGYNLALRGVVALAGQLITARSEGTSLGDLAMLQQFYDERVNDQQRTIGFSDYTMKLFSSHNPLLGLGRDIGLQLLEICPPAKTLFARSAMGLDSPAPDLKRKGY